MSNNTNGTGLSFPGMLAILFIGLKLTGFINWSWWWVLSPLWIFGGILLIIFAVGLIAGLIHNYHLKKKRKK